MIERGKFIVLYGANNLGKSAQAEMLVDAITDLGFQVEALKYPIYDLKPTGPKINTVLRLGSKMDEFELQKIYAQNRLDYQPILDTTLKSGRWVIAEDYNGTGVAWGIVRGIPQNDLEALNRGLIKEDLAILLHGERFTSGIEKNHRNEADDEVWHQAQMIHLCLAEVYGWRKVYATRTAEAVHQDILKIVRENLL
ncbi:MAG: hypothetical protein Q7R97_04315 [Candidatus Daviesbacteria bacterium]|nr:hypothetical protein [Candidatus Daviesbacteria bacterium]